MDDETLTNFPNEEPSPIGPGGTFKVGGAFLPASQDLSGTTIGGYQLVRKVAAGGMGVVYEAIQLRLNRKVALKILTEQLAARPEFFQRFEREARAAAALNHPNVVQVHDFGEADGRHFLIMEYVEGEDLSASVARHGKLPVVDALNAVEQAALALKAAFDKSIIHRDIKPANLMLTTDGQIKVSDMGLAKILTETSDATMTGVTMGSPYFIAPEQVEDARNVDHRADIYSLGVTLLNLVTGRVPFEGGTPFSIALSHVNKPLPTGKDLGTDLPVEVEGLIRRMTAKNPDERYQEYGTLIADVQRVKAGFAPALEMSGESFWNSKTFYLTTVAAVVIVAGLVAVATFHLKKHRAPKEIKVAEVTPAPPVVSEQPRPASQNPPNDQSFEPEPSGPRGARPPRNGQRGPGGPDGSNERGFGQPGDDRPAGGNLRLNPMGRPRDPEFNAIPEGPINTMMAAANDYAVKHKDDDVLGIIDRYRQIREAGAGTPQERDAERLEARWAQAFNRISGETIRKYQTKMEEKLKAGTAQDAWDVWRDFPLKLRTREVDDEIRSILDKALPKNFTPTR